MENASKALMMAAGILVGVLILALMTTLFINSQSVSSSYEERKKTEAIQQFNVNFTKYLGQNLTMHEVVTICNFADSDNNRVLNVITQKDSGSYELNKNQIAKDVEDAREYETENVGQKAKVVYKMEIEEYNENGYVSKIKFSNRHIEVVN